MENLEEKYFNKIQEVSEKIQKIYLALTQVNIKCQLNPNELVSNANSLGFSINTSLEILQDIDKFTKEKIEKQNNK